MTRRRLITIAAVLTLLGTSFLLWRRCAPRPENQRAGKFPEQLVYVRSKDNIVNGGVIFAPPKDLAKPIAIILIPGLGANFYHPTSVGIVPALPQRPSTPITLN